MKNLINKKAIEYIESRLHIDNISILWLFMSIGYFLLSMMSVGMIISGQGIGYIIRSLTILVIFSLILYLYACKQVKDK